MASSADEVTDLILIQYFCVTSNIVRAAWYIMFHSTWRRFEQLLLPEIIVNLTQLSKSCGQNAVSISLAELKHQRLYRHRKFEENEAQTNQYELRKVQEWLAVDEIQETRLNGLAKRCQPGSCEWIFRNDSITSWKLINHDTPVIWMQGNPGSGRATLLF